MDTPTRTTNIPSVTALDEVVGNVIQGGVKRTRRQSMGNLAAQLAGTEPLASQLAAVDADTSALQLRIDGHDGEIAALDTRVDGVEAGITTLSGAITTPGKVYLNKAARDADLAPAAGTLAQVTSDADFQVNEYLSIKVGATMTGSWSLTTIPSPAFNNRRIDDIENEPGLRNGFLSNNNDKWNALALKDSTGALVVGASQDDGAIQVGAWTHKPNLARHDPYEPGGYPCYISAGDVVVIADNGPFVIDGGTYEFSACGPGKTFVCAAWNKAAMDEISAVQIDRNGEIFAPYGKTLATGFFVYGQSNGAASRAVGAGMSINPDPDHIWMPSTGYSSDMRLNLNTAAGTAPVLAPGAITGFVPMDSVPGELAFTSGQTPIESLCYALHDEIVRKLNFAPVMIGASLAVGGFSLSQLTVGTQPYNNFLTAVTDITSAALAAGYRYWIPAIIWQGGESDATNANYVSEMVALRSGLNAALKAITGQASDIWFIMAAPASFAKGQDKAVTAMVQLHRDYPDAFVLSHPMYPLDFDIGEPGSETDNDYIHLAVRGQQLNGEYHKKTWRRTVYGKARPNPLMSTGTGVLAGLTITIPMLVPVAPMVIDTTTVTERSGTNKGLVFVDDSGAPPTISAVAVSGNNLVLTLSGPSTGTPSSRFVEVGLEGHDATAPFSFSEMARCNIRDSDSARAVFDPTVIPYNWAVAERIPITV